MGKGIILKSASFQPGVDDAHQDEARQKNLEKAVEKAGFEAEPGVVAELPSPPAELNENLTLQQSLEKSVNSYTEKLDSARKTHEDWDQLKARFEKQDVFVGEATQVAIVEQENGPEITYYLMQHPEYARKLGRLCRAGRGVTAATEIKNLSNKLGGHTYRPQSARREPPPENASFEQIIAYGRSYPGRMRDIRRALRRR